MEEVKRIGSWSQKFISRTQQNLPGGHDPFHFSAQHQMFWARLNNREIPGIPESTPLRVEHASFYTWQERRYEANAWAGCDRRSSLWKYMKLGREAKPDQPTIFTCYWFLKHRQDKEISISVSGLALCYGGSVTPTSKLSLLLERPCNVVGCHDSLCTPHRLLHLIEKLWFNLTLIYIPPSQRSSFIDGS